MIVGVEQLLENIAACLEVPRNRMGRLKVTYGPAQEYFHRLAVEYDVGGCRDQLEQIAKVIRAILEHPLDPMEDCE